MKNEELFRASRPLGIYLHVPFCASACEFCAFYQEKPKRVDLDRYLVGIEREIERTLIPMLAPGHPYTSALIFWGGGTPGLLPPEDIFRLGSTLKKSLGTLPIGEWSVEVAPSVVKAQKVAALLDLGVTRFSMGVQSFETKLLEAMGRLHSPQQVYAAYDLLRSGGAKNVNLDMIFALPGQNFSDWQRDLKAALILNPEHLSTYCLTFEEDTKLYAKLMRGQVHKRSAEAESQFYEQTWKILADAGFEQYEVSNFAKPRHACLHNINTWNMGEWIGLGPAAASQCGRFRFQNHANLDQWLKSVEMKVRSFEEKITDAQDFTMAAYTNVETLSPALIGADALIFGLRLNSGIGWFDWKKRFVSLADHFSILENIWLRMIDEELLDSDAFAQNCLRVTNVGRLLLDAIGTQILEVLDS
jgi:oxygen-independent coproporphyrinogen III oxidase